MSIIASVFSLDRLQKITEPDRKIIWLSIGIVALYFSIISLVYFDIFRNPEYAEKLLLADQHYAESDEQYRSIETAAQAVRLALENYPNIIYLLCGTILWQICYSLILFMGLVWIVIRLLSDYPVKLLTQFIVSSISIAGLIIGILINHIIRITSQWFYGSASLVWFFRPFSAKEIVDILSCKFDLGFVIFALLFSYFAKPITQTTFYEILATLFLCWGVLILVSFLLNFQILLTS